MRAVAAQQLPYRPRADVTIATHQLKIDERDMTIAKQQGALKIYRAHEALMSSWAVRLSTALRRLFDLATIAGCWAAVSPPRRFTMDRKSS